MMLLYHPISKTYNEFEEVCKYHFDDINGSLIETDKELVPGSIVILKDISEFAIIIKDVWEVDGEKCFTHDSAKEIIVRGRLPKLNIGREVFDESGN